METDRDQPTEAKDPTGASQEVVDEVSVSDEIWARVTDIGQAFSPGAPITSKDLFSGRVVQMAKVLEVVSQRGGHGVLYGERGVGKTSLAAVVSEMLRAQRRLTVRVNCSAGDSFAGAWRRVLGEISLTSETPQVGFGDKTRVTIASAESLLGEEPVTPDRVRRALGVLSDLAPVVVFVDEFDRLDRDARAPFADLIKALSDYVVNATVILVGVAEDVNELIAEHRSVERSLTEVLMPRMSPKESKQIVERGLQSISMTIEPGALESITRLSKGLPHYTHLLAQEAAISSAWQQRNEVTETDLRVAVENAIDKAQQTVKNDYHKATYSPRKINLYPFVLRACALASKDDLGFFAPADVREPLSELLKRKADIPIFQQHLNAFTLAGRGEVLQRRGEPRRFRYRFTDPLLEPFVILRGLRDDAQQREQGK
jgi:Cdc6-like AAA superfamily ATPase